jgi:hypothetical protein
MLGFRCWSEFNGICKNIMPESLKFFIRNKHMGILLKRQVQCLKMIGTRHVSQF